MASDRKLRLFACACGRRVWHLLKDERCQNALETGEQYADGLVAEARLSIVQAASMEPSRDINTDGKAHSPIAAIDMAACVACDAVRDNEDFHTPPEQDDFTAASDAAYCAAACFEYSVPRQKGRAAWTRAQNEAREAERRVQAALLKDIFGNPWRPITLDLLLLTPTLSALARAAYEERSLPSGELDPTRLAILADALEEAGCTDTAILDHLRGPGPHVRGCWPLDLCLNKSAQ
jgi:hypothetical protein